MNAFTKDYYENGRACGLSCYENYRWLPELTIPMCERLIAQLHHLAVDLDLDRRRSRQVDVRGLALGHQLEDLLHVSAAHVVLPWCAKDRC
jgi:hypothetical protein